MLGISFSPTFKWKKEIFKQRRADMRTVFISNKERWKGKLSTYPIFKEHLWIHTTLSSKRAWNKKIRHYSSFQSSSSSVPPKAICKGSFSVSMHIGSTSETFKKKKNTNAWTPLAVVLQN